MTVLLVLPKFRARGTTKASFRAHISQIKRTRSFRQCLDAKINTDPTKKVATEMALTRLHTHC